jgi:hypothetical protein
MAQGIVTLIPNVLQLVADDTANTFTVQAYNSTAAAWVSLVTLDLPSGALQALYGINPNVAVQSLAGTTGGTVYWTMPFQGSGYKKVLVYLDAYENDTTTAQTITYPTAFTQVPNIYNPAGVPGVSTTTTALSLAPDTTTAYTGWIEVVGY